MCEKEKTGSDEEAITDAELRHLGLTAKSPDDLRERIKTASNKPCSQVIRELTAQIENGITDAIPVKIIGEK